MSRRPKIGAGYGGDRIEPAERLAAVPDLDRLAFECLAERTFALAGGVTRTLRMDGHGKSLSFVVLGIGLDP